MLPLTGAACAESVHVIAYIQMFACIYLFADF